MGRLFWKFFLFIWLLQLAGMVAVGTSFWLRHRAEEPHFDEHYVPPPPPFEAPFKRPPQPPRHPPHGHIPIEPLVATFLASLAGAALMANYFSKPIRQLKQAIDAASTGNLTIRLGDTMGKRRDELADLGRDFDLMADKLSTLMDSQRQLLHDVSHELRSPLARLQAAIGLGRQSQNHVQKMMDRIELETIRIDKLVEELLTLSRVTAGVTGRTKENFDLGELLLAIVDNARFEAEPKRQTIILDGESNLLLQGHPELLFRAIENIVRNALKHAPPESIITLTCSTFEPSNTVMLKIEDEGPGVPEDELDHIFKAFYRGSHSKNIDGQGLGLAIAQRVVLTHGGTISAFNRKKRGLCIEIRLPFFVHLH